MTLEQWMTQYEVITIENKARPQAIYVPFSQHLNEHETWQMFHLTDYVVSSASGGVYCLVPRHN